MPEVQAQAGRRVYSAWSAPVTITTAGLARAVTEVVRAPDTTVADLQGLAVALEAALREAAQLRADVAAAAGAPNLTLATYRWTVAGSLAGIVGALIALLAYVQAVAKDAEPDPAPQVDVNVNVQVEQPPSPPIAVQPDQGSADEGHAEPVAPPTPPADDRRGADG